MGVINTIFDLLVVTFTLALLANKFSPHSIALYVNLNYFLATILLFGFFNLAMVAER